MTVKLFLAGIDVGGPRIEEDHPGGTVRIILNDRGDWLTVENRRDCSALMRAAVDADSVFIRQQAAAEAREVVAAELAPVPEYMCQWCAEVPVPAPGLCEGCQQNDDAVEFKAAHDANCLCMAEQDDLPPLPQRIPGGPPDVPGWQAAINAGLSPEALAGSQPLASLAPDPAEPEPQEEAQA